MRVYHLGSYQYWYDRSTACWWGANFPSGLQEGNAFHAYTKAEIIGEIHNRKESQK